MRIQKTQISENKTEESFKINLARALDENLHTRQWHNIVDWLIIAMILISTTEIFLSTFDLDLNFAASYYG